jgi:hypothetical protein
MVPSAGARQEVGRLVIENQRKPTRSQAVDGFVGSDLKKRGKR